MNFQNMQVRKALNNSGLLTSSLLLLLCAATGCGLMYDPHMFDHRYEENFGAYLAKTYNREAYIYTYVDRAESSDEFLKALSIPKNGVSVISNEKNGGAYNILRDTDAVGFTFADSGHMLIIVFFTLKAEQHASIASDIPTQFRQSFGNWPSGDHRPAFVTKIPLPGNIGKSFWTDAKSPRETILIRAFSPLSMLARIPRVDPREIEASKSANPWALRNLLMAIAMTGLIIFLARRLNRLKRQFQEGLPDNTKTVDIWTFFWSHDLSALHSLVIEQRNEEREKTHQARLSKELDAKLLRLISSASWKQEAELLAALSILSGGSIENRQQLLRTLQSAIEQSVIAPPPLPDKAKKVAELAKEFLRERDKNPRGADPQAQRFYLEGQSKSNLDDERTCYVEAIKIQRKVNRTAEELANQAQTLKARAATAK